MVNKCELSVNRRHSQQAKDADRLGPNGARSAQGLKTSLSWINDRRRIERTSPTLADKRNTVSSYRSHWEDKLISKHRDHRVCETVHTELCAAEDADVRVTPR